MERAKLKAYIFIFCLSILAGGSTSQKTIYSDQLSILVEHDANDISPPILKSKLGVARATGYWQLPKTIAYTRQIGSRAFCSTISFDETIDSTKSNYALGGSSFLPQGIKADPKAQLWLQSLIKNLHIHNQQIFLGLVGAPRPYQQPNIRKPAAHPTPTNIPASAQLTADWVRLFLPKDIPVNWVIWNEPEHTLRGSNSPLAAHEMVSIYQAYQNVLAGATMGDGFGLASFMKASLRESTNSPRLSFAEIVINNLARSRATPFDFITLNSYHGGTNELISHLDFILKSAGLDQPLVLNQFAPELIGSDPAIAGSIQAASLYVHHLDNFIRQPEIASACMSFWAGSDRKALLREDKYGALSPSIPFQALSWFQEMPLWRLSIQPNSSDMPYTIWASHEEDYAQLLIMPSIGKSMNGISAGRKGKVMRKEFRKRLRQKERIEQHYDLANKTTVRSTESATRPSLLTIHLPDYPNRGIKLERLLTSATTPVTEKLRTDNRGRISFAITPDQIALLSIGTEILSPPLLPILRTDLYIHRDAPKQGWASVDPLRDGFVLALPTKSSVAHASATYEAKKIRSSLVLQLKSPDGSAGIKRGLSCSAMALQRLDPKQPEVLASWGNPKIIDRMMKSRAFVAANHSLMQQTRSWGQPSHNGHLSLTLPNIGRDLPIRVHLAAEHCAAPAQLQVRVLS